MKTLKDYKNYLDNIKNYAAEEGCAELDPIFEEHLRCRFFGEEVLIAESDRILLREMKISDADFFLAFSDAWTEEVLCPFIKNTPEETKEYLRSYIDTMYPLYDYGMWSVVLKDTGTVIGICGLGTYCSAEAVFTDLGYYICPEFRRKGFAQESAALTLQYAADYLKLPEIYAVIRNENEKSAAFAEKIGFEKIKMEDFTDPNLQIFRKNLNLGLGK
ncbi:MAG: GNAT family N-acetyltransferase [Lachnospiraceae bacterium]